MALRNQPYIPLYVNDFITDEKLIECSAESTGVYIRLLCIMHKPKDYGIITLAKKDIKSENVIENFAIKLTKQMPYSTEIIMHSLQELFEENVIKITGNKLIQKRMVKDNKLSETRAKAVSNRYKQKEICTYKNDTNINTNEDTKCITNTENEIVVVNENANTNKNINENKNNYEYVINYYIEKIINDFPPPHVQAYLQECCEQMDSETIVFAMDIAIAEKKKSWSYIKGILKNYKANNIKTKSDAISEMERFENGKQKRHDEKSGDDDEFSLSEILQSIRGK